MPQPGPDDTRSGSGGRTKSIALSLVPLGLLLVVFGGALIFSAALRGEMATAGSLLIGRDAEGLRDWLLQFGIWAPVISGLLQVATSVFPPGPSFLLGIANAMLYGAVLGGLLTFVTALIAAAVCFGIARVIGRPGIERLVSEESVRRMDRFMDRRGILAVFLGRLVPFINPDVVSYAAGVTKMRWGPFLLAMGAGSVPATVFYSIVGAAALEFAGWVVLAVVVSTLLPIALLAVLGPRFGGWRR